jgi:hypothetical protein
MIDFRGTVIHPEDTIIYVGRQDMKASLTEATVQAVSLDGNTIIAWPTRSSNPLGPPSGKLVQLRVARKVVVIKKGRHHRANV